LRIIQFTRGAEKKPVEIENLEDLLASISRDDLGCTEPVKFIYSGNNEFPFGAREQWTDSCNLLALKDGVVIGYDRNDKTLEAFGRPVLKPFRPPTCWSGLNGEKPIRKRWKIPLSCCRRQNCRGHGAVPTA
jgi:hypothetical protein